MKKFWFVGFVIVIMATLVLTGCPNGQTDPVDPPTPEPVPPTFEEVVAGKFWSVDKLERYQVTTRNMVNPYELEVCFYFGEDGYLTFWVDENEDGLLSPSEEIGYPIPWSIDGNMLTIDGEVWGLSYFGADGWAIEADVTGTDIGDLLGNEGTPYEGWIRVHYVPCLKGFDDNVLTFDFAFVFDDMHDTKAEWVRSCFKRWKLDVEYDWADGFYFTSGTPADSYLDADPLLGVHIAIISYHDGMGDDIDTIILIGSEAYGLDVYDVPPGFDPMHVYDMEITVDSADVGEFAFVSRVDGDGFDVDVTLDRSAMGELQIRGVDDVDVPVVNPSL